MKTRNFLFSFCLCAICLGVPATAQIRDYVGVVRTTIRPELITPLQVLKSRLKSDGYSDLADYVEGYLKGGFGSGFAYVAKDGKNYIVTNRHVVSQANVTSVEFEHLDGKKVRYEGLSVLAVDDDIDLALLAFPDGVAPFTVGMTLDPTVPDDGSDIWSAGFPALGNDPMWQLGKGTVTNSRARIPDLADPEKTFLIQHSAQVDSGNSGGPLLLEDKKVPGGYRVVGVNTWKAVDRQAANFSIPSAAVETFIAKALTGSETEATPEKIDARTQDFVNAISGTDSAYWSVAKYVSFDYAADSGVDALRSVISRAPTDVRDDILYEFVHYSPIEAMRYAIAYRLVNDVSGSSDSFTVSVGAAKESGDGKFAVEVSSGFGTWDCAWVKDQGLWRVASFTKHGSEKKQDKKAESKQKSASNEDAGNDGFSFDSPYTILLEGGYGRPLGGEASGIISVKVLGSLLNFLSIGVIVDRQEDELMVTDSSGILQTEHESTVTVTMFNGQVRLQLPLLFEKIAVVPYAQAGFGLGFGDFDDDMSLCSGTAYGGGLLLSFGSDRLFYAECDYSIHNNSFIGTIDKDIADMTTKNISLSVGIGAR